MTEKQKDAARQIAARSARLAADHLMDPERLDGPTLLAHVRSMMKLTAYVLDDGGDKDDAWGSHYSLLLTNAAGEIT